MERHRRGRRMGIRRDPSAPGEAGFTLIETMLGILLLTVGLLAVADVFPRGLALAAYGKNQTKAANLAERWIEDLKSGPTFVLGQDAGDYGTASSQYFDQNLNPATAAAAVFTVDLQVQYWTWNAAAGAYAESATPYAAPGAGPYVYRVSAAAHWLVNDRTAFTSGNVGSPNGCVAGGAAAPTASGCVQVSTFVTP